VIERVAEKRSLSLRIILTDGTADRVRRRRPGELLSGLPSASISPLFDAIDSDALNDIVDYDVTIQGGTGQVQFEYAGHSIIVDSSGRVGVSETDE
jgi:hypothetical protein